jgi:HSP20 family protein
MLYRTAPIFGLRREIDKLFEDTFGGGNEGSFSWNPAVDVRETGNELRLDVELPGIRPEEVEVTAESGVLTIRGEKRSERKEDDNARYHVVERSYGSFMRSFQLPQGLEEEQIEATYDNGILSIHIPKAALPQPRRIQITPGTGQKAVGTGTKTGQEVKATQGATSGTKQSTRNRDMVGTTT